MTGADALAKCLQNEHVEYVFGYPGVAIAPFLFIAVCRLSFLRAWDNQTSLVPRVIEAVVGIVKFERIMFGHSKVAI